MGATLRPAKKRRLQENDPDVSPPSDTGEGDDDCVWRLRRLRR